MDSFRAEASSSAGDITHQTRPPAAAAAPTPRAAAPLDWSRTTLAMWAHVLADGGEALYAGGFTYQVQGATEDLKITEMTPALASPMGGTHMVIQGVGLEAGCTATLEGSAALALAFQSGALLFEAPQHVPGELSLDLHCPLGNAATTLVYKHTFDGSIGDWPASTEVAENTLATDWGSDDWLQAIFAGSDGETLYIGVLGKTQDAGFGKNAMVLYLDTDFGAGTGLSDAGIVTDTDGAPDDALGGVLQISAEGFGAEFGLATLDLADYWPAADDAATAEAGWRRLDDPTNLGWLEEAPVIGGEVALEASIPLSDLYGDPAGLPRTLAITARIVSGNGDFASNQALPGLQGDEPEATNDEVAVFGLSY